jgi:hypothetical protein
MNELWRRALETVRHRFLEWSRHNPLCRLHILVGDTGTKIDPTEVCGTNLPHSDYLHYWTSGKCEGRKVELSVVWQPAPKMPNGESVHDLFRESGRICQLLPPALPPSVDTADDDRWLFLLFRLAWEEFPGSPLRADSDILETDSMHTASLQERREMPVGLRSVLGMDPFRASVAAIDILLSAEPADVAGAIENWKPQHVVNGHPPDPNPLLTNPVERLKIVRERVRHHARTEKAFDTALRESFAAYSILCDRYNSECRANAARKRQLARDVLKSGRLTDPKLRQGVRRLVIIEEGLCPIELAKYRVGKRPESRREVKALADVVLAAMDKRDEFESAVPSRQEQISAEYIAAITAGTHVCAQWDIEVACPKDWKIPPDPHSLERVDLARFPEDEFRTIAFYHLGGLADLGAVRLLVPRPQEGRGMAGVPEYAAWKYRHPTQDGIDAVDPDPDPTFLNPNIAEQMLDHVEAWFRQTGRNGDGKPQLDSAGAGPAGEVQNSRKSGWTRKQLIERTPAPHLGATSFRRLREEARLPPGKKGRRFSEEELRLMMKCAPNAIPQEAKTTVDAWAKLLEESRK